MIEIDARPYDPFKSQCVSPPKGFRKTPSRRPTPRETFGQAGQYFETIETLRAAAPSELGQTSTYGWNVVYPVFVRADAYLAAHRGSGAAVEFQKVLYHPGVVANQPIGALAHLGLARAYVLQGDSVKAKAACQNFLAF